MKRNGTRMINRHTQPISPNVVSSELDLRSGYESTHEQHLRTGKDHWNRWRNDNPSIWPLLMGADLRDLDLSGFDLHFASLQKANLTNVNLSGAWLASVHFEQAVLDGAQLDSAFAE